MKIETLAAHSGLRPDPTTGAVTPSIHLSTTFQRAEDGAYPSGYIYSRVDNPGRRLLEDSIRELEGGAVAAAFSSGAAARAAVCQALSTGDHVIAPTDVYHGTTSLLRDVFTRWALDTTFVDTTDLDQVRQALGHPHSSTATNSRSRCGSPFHNQVSRRPRGCRRWHSNRQSR